MIDWLTLSTPLLIAIGGLAGVRGTTDCPSPEAVSALLPGMLTPGASADQEVAFIDTAGPDLAIEIRGPDGSLRLTRRLQRPPGPPAATCSALAAAVAVVIATWEIEQSSELSLLQPGVYPPAPEPEVGLRAVPLPPGAAPDSGGWNLLVGAGVGTSISQSGLVPTAELQLGLRRSANHLGVWLSLAADGENQATQAGGTSTWRRLAAGLGPWVAMGRGMVAAEVGAQLFVGRTSVEGSGFASNQSDGAISLGIEGLARLVGTGDVQPFVEGAVRGWFARQEIDVLPADQPDGRASLPRVEGRLTVGVRFRLGT